MKSSGMRWVDQVRLRVRSLAKRADAERELDEELSFHFEEAVASYRSQGMGEEDARRRARLEFRGPAQLSEEMRDARGVNWVENIARDVAYGWRSLRAQPAFALAAIAALALGAGFNAAMFTLLYGILLRPLPVPDPGSVFNVHVRTFGKEGRGTYGSEYVVSYKEFAYMRDHAKSAELSGLGRVNMSWKENNRQVSTSLVSGNYFAVIGAAPQFGRFFRPEEMKPGTGQVVVLSYPFWQARFNSEPGAVGRSMTLNGRLFEIIGVANQAVIGSELQRSDIWIPITAEPLARPQGSLIDDAKQAWIKLLARRKPGLSNEQLAAEMGVIAQQSLASHYKEQVARAVVRSGAFLNSPEISEEAGPLLAALVAAVTLILLVACANVANMLLARGAMRGREIAVRLSIGASRGRIIQQLLAESSLLAILGTVLGLVLGIVGAKAVLASTPDTDLLALDITPDFTVFSYLVALGILSALAFGLVPALQSLRVDLTPSLKGEIVSASGRGGRRWIQPMLVGVQVAVSLSMLICALLLLRGFWTGLNMDPGHARRNVLATTMDLASLGYSEATAASFWERAIERASQIPGVQAVSRTTGPPIRSTSHMGADKTDVDGQSIPGDVTVQVFSIAPHYLETMRISLLEGREFTRQEIAVNAKVGIIDKRLADRFFPGRSPIGHRIYEVEVVGVANPLQTYLFGGKSNPALYTPIKSAGVGTLLVRYEGPQRDTAQALERELKAIEPGLMVASTDISAFIEDRVFAVKVISLIAAAMGSAALFLACTGIYGVVAFLMNRRLREIGIRLALGGSRSSVVRAVAAPGVRAIVVGWAIGLAIAAAATQVLKGLLYGLSPLDPLAFGGAALLLLLAAGLAILIPARRAVSVDPAVVLREY